MSARRKCLSRTLACWSLALVTAAVMAGAVAAAATAPKRVAILPFTANAKEDMSFLVKGVKDMLATRLAWQDQVTVVESDLVTRALTKVKPPLNDEKARQVGTELSADVVVYGTITVLGKSVSVDARVVRVDQPGPALTAFVQAADMDQVIPQINDFAQRINAEIFKRPEAIAAREEARQAAAQPSGGGGGGGDSSPGEDSLASLPANISPLNPLFQKQLSGVESDRYWRSPRIPGTITSVAVADIDLDGKNELLVLLPDRLRVYRLSGQHFALINEMKNGPKGTYLFVDAADIDGNGRPEIFVTNHLVQSVESFVLEWQPNGGLGYKVKSSPWYFRVQMNPTGSGHVLYGQKAAVDSPFFGPIYKLKFSKDDYVPDVELALPKMASIFNFCMADLNGTGSPQPVLVGPSYHLRVFSRSLDQMWMGSEQFAATGKFIKYMALSGTGYEDSWWYLNTRLVPVDLDGDKRQEVVVVQNSSRMNMVVERIRLFYQGTIFGLSWNGMSLGEDWRTPRMSGNLTDYQVADVGNVGRPALVMSLATANEDNFFSNNQSHVVAFTIKPQKRKPVINKGL